jgi:integrase/recombinase XerD
MVDKNHCSFSKENAMGQLRDRMEEDLKLGGYSPSTRKIYLLYSRLFSKYHMRSPAEMGEKEIREYLLHLVEERGVSRETYRQVRAALTFLYAVTLRRAVEVAHLPVRRKQHRLPVVLSGTEVSTLLEAITSLKYQSVIMAIYAGGLRISEACKLRPEEIDSKRMVIHVRAGKGGRDRYTVLSTRLLVSLRAYWRACCPTGDWLFPGQDVEKHVCPETVRTVFKKALASSGIKKDVTPHTLRHCFATHLIEIGTDVTVIQALLGHGSIRATEVYTHISLDLIARTPSPLDILDTPAASVMG